MLMMRICIDFDVAQVTMLDISLDFLIYSLYQHYDIDINFIILNL